MHVRVASINVLPFNDSEFSHFCRWQARDPIMEYPSPLLPNAVRKVAGCDSREHNCAPRKRNFELNVRSDGGLMDR